MNEYSQAYLAPLLVVAFLLFDARRMLSRRRQNTVLKALMICMGMSMLLDVAAWTLGGRPELIWLLWTLNILYFAFAVACGPLWFAYAFMRMKNDDCFTQRALLCQIAVPCALFAALLVSTPFTGLVFTIDELGRYHRGTLVWVQQVMNFAYIIVPAVTALWLRKGEQLPDKRSQLGYLALFVVLPFLSAIASTFVYGLTFLWPAVTASLLMIYINLQHSQISTDVLTGLNNRGRLESYLHQLCAHPQRDWCFVLMDVDGFKAINDKYGHISGDEALRDVADCLKLTFAKREAFLARYGGDEFAVVLFCRRDSEVQRTTRELDSAVRQLDGCRPWSIRVSVGHARYSTDAYTPAELIALADKRMYQDKLKSKTALR